MNRMHREIDIIDRFGKKRFIWISEHNEWNQIAGKNWFWTPPEKETGNDFEEHGHKEWKS